MKESFQSDRIIRAVVVVLEFRFEFDTSTAILRKQPTFGDDTVH